MDKNASKRAEEYYDDVQILYNLFWPGKALHYGFWDEKTKKLSECVDNTDKFVSKLLELQKNDYVLDAGCGVGGSSFFIAKNFGVKVMGITLSQKQIKQARKNVIKQNLDNLVKFEIMDFNKTNFKNDTFTKILCIESACHAKNKLEFLKEAYRILKPGGRIVIDDGFLAKRELTGEEEEVYNKFLNGWKVPDLSHKDDFLRYLKEAGFKNIIFYDKTENVIPSSKRIALYGYLFYPISLILSKLKLVSRNIHEHTVCMINQQKTFNRFTIYGVFSAEK